MTGWLCATLAVLLCARVLLWRRRRERALYARLDAMLEAAVEGRFRVRDYDETQLSALESRLAQYLQAGADSSARLAVQRDQIASLVSDVSHQTKTPVANLRLYSQLLAEEPLTPQAAECAAVIAAQSEKLDVLISGLVKSSRLETGILALHPQENALAPIITGAVQQYTAKARARGITLTQGDVSGVAVCDARWTEEALANLIDNAVKYTPSGGHVHVEAASYEFFSVLRVRDDGPGIAEAEQAQIFSRFYRSPAVYGQPGVGIGLYLVRQIAQGQGGYVKCSSAPGRGSTFALYLPRCTASGKESEPC